MEDHAADEGIIAASLTDPAAFGLIFDRHYDAIHRYLARRGGWALAEDLAMSVFLKAFESRRRFRPSADDARPWLSVDALSVAEIDACLDLATQMRNRCERGEPEAYAEALRREVVGLAFYEASTGPTMTPRRTRRRCRRCSAHRGAGHLRRPSCAGSQRRNWVTNGRHVDSRGDRRPV